MTDRAMEMVVEAGKAMLENGGEVFRAQDTMEIMARSLGIQEFRVYVLTNGTAGPGGMDMTMSMLIKNEGTGIQARTGYASAISLVVLVIVGTLLIIQQIIQKRGED